MPRLTRGPNGQRYDNGLSSASYLPVPMKALHRLGHILSLGVLGLQVLEAASIADYAIIQLGNNSTAQQNEGVLDIHSNSSVFGSVLKGVDNGGNAALLSTSKVTGG